MFFFRIEFDVVCVCGVVVGNLGNCGMGVICCFFCGMFEIKEYGE